MSVVVVRPVEVYVTVGEWEYEIPPLPAADWFAAVLAEDGGAIVPGLLCAADRKDIWADFLSGAVAAEDVAEVERAALTAAAGRPWWQADRLIRNTMADENRAILFGELMLRGLRLEEISLAAALDAIYALVRRLLSHDEPALARFEAGLAVIPAGVPVEELQEETTDEAEFMAMMQEQAQMFGG